MAGSYRKRGKDSYELRYRGKRKSIVAVNDTKAEIALAAFVTEVDKGKFREPAKITVMQFIEKHWIRDHVEINLAPGTRSLYKLYLKNRIIPALGDLKLDQVKPGHLLDFYANLREDGIREDRQEGALSPATIQKYHNILSSMFKSAVEWQFIDDNPVSKVKPPRVANKEPYSLDFEQSSNLIKGLINEPLKYRLIVILAITLGLRRGEILGLPSQVDFDNKVFKIMQTCQHVDGKVYLKEPKTKRSIRTVAFPDEIAPLLKLYITELEKQKSKCGDKWEESGLLFTQWNGKPMHPNSIGTWFKRFKEKNNLPEKLTFHSLRHTNITLLLNSGVDIGSVSDNVGHAKKSTTLDIYFASIPSTKRLAADKMGTLFGDLIPELLEQPIK